jgi:hypothetical protein
VYFAAAVTSNSRCQHLRGWHCSGKPSEALLMKSRHPIERRNKSVGFDPVTVLEDIAGF